MVWSQYPYLLHLRRKAWSCSRSAAVQKPDHAGAQYNSRYTAQSHGKRLSMVLLEFRGCAMCASSSEHWNRLTSVHRHDRWELDDYSLPHRGSSICRHALCLHRVAEAALTFLYLRVP